jgi:hypothetical protein
MICYENQIIVLSITLFFNFNIFSDCLVGNCSSGYGSAIFPKGDSYSGTWRNGKAEGKGILKYKDGGVYSGDWRDGKADGQGTMVYSDGSKYEGGWKASLAHGLGTMYDIDGTVIYTGLWNFGKMMETSFHSEKNLAQKEVKN